MKDKIYIYIKEIHIYITKLFPMIKESIYPKCDFLRKIHMKFVKKILMP